MVARKQGAKEWFWMDGAFFSTQLFYELALPM
jgi:hypothetical protein